jgi:hypothetical protein
VALKGTDPSTRAHTHAHPRTHACAQATAYIAPGIADGSDGGGPPLSEEDAVRSTVVQRIEFLDANFLAALNGYIDAAGRDPEGPVGELLPLMEMMRNEVLYQVHT